MPHSTTPSMDTASNATGPAEKTSELIAASSDVLRYDAVTKMADAAPAAHKPAMHDPTRSTLSSSNNAKKKSPNLYAMLTEIGSKGIPGNPFLKPVDPFAWLQQGRTKRRRHSSPMLASMTSDPALMASSGLVPPSPSLSNGSTSSASASTFGSSPATPMAMMSLSPTLPKMPLVPLPPNAHKSSDEERLGSGRRHSSPMILPLNLKPEEMADEAWWNEMLRSRLLFLEDTKDVDWENITVIELKRILRKYGLHSVGKKSLLVERIQLAIEHLRIMSLERPKVLSPAPIPQQLAYDKHPQLHHHMLNREFVGGKIEDLVAAAEEKSRQQELQKMASVRAQPNTKD